MCVCVIGGIWGMYFFEFVSNIVRNLHPIRTQKAVIQPIFFFFFLGFSLKKSLIVQSFSLYQIYRPKLIGTNDVLLFLTFSLTSPGTYKFMCICWCETRFSICIISRFCTKLSVPGAM